MRKVENFHFFRFLDGNYFFSKKMMFFCAFFEKKNFKFLEYVVWRCSMFPRKNCLTFQCLISTFFLRFPSMWSLTEFLYPFVKVKPGEIQQNTNRQISCFHNVISQNVSNRFYPNYTRLEYWLILQLGKVWERLHFYLPRYDNFKMARSHNLVKCKKIIKKMVFLAFISQNSTIRFYRNLASLQYLYVLQVGKVLVEIKLLYLRDMPLSKLQESTAVHKRA